MKTNNFFDWKLILDENNVIQLKPTWDCVISIDDKNKAITIRHADFLRENN